jgi:peptidoglycan hydrolase-like protein with peptidoglycan-binding domain
VPILADMRDFLQDQLRRPVTYVGTGFVLITLAIFANALFLQPRRHPAPFFPHETEKPAAPVNDPLVHAVQDGLLRLGLYGGTVDGIAGPNTAAAIRAFEAGTGRRETGVATPDLLAAIAATAASRQAPDAEPQSTSAAADSRSQTGAGAAAPASGAASAEHDPLVAAVQNALAVSAYGPLTADGVAGPETRAAIERFQRDHNLPVTGEVSESLVLELRAAGAMSDVATSGGG